MAYDRRRCFVVNFADITVDVLATVLVGAALYSLEAVC